MFRSCWAAHGQRYRSCSDINKVRSKSIDLLSRVKMIIITGSPLQQREPFRFRFPIPAVSPLSLHSADSTSARLCLLPCVVCLPDNPIFYVTMDLL